MILPVAQPAIRPTRITQIIQNIETSSIVEDGKQPASFLKMPDGQSDCHGSLFAWEEHCQAEGARPSSVRPLLTCSGVRQSSTPLTTSPGPGEDAPASIVQAGLGGGSTPFPTQSVSLWLNQPMFARKIRVEYEDNGQRHPCPMKWLDSFSMRNFTNASVFDDTLPVADGLMEIGTRVPLVELKDAMEDWFRRKSYLPKGTV